MTRRFTWAGRSSFGRVESLKTTTTTSRSRIFHLAPERREERRDSLIEMSINGRSAAEIAEIALRVTLFQERNPLEDQHMGFMTEMADPLAPLRAARVPDEIVRPLAELLIVGTRRIRPCRTGDGVQAGRVGRRDAEADARMGALQPLHERAPDDPQDRRTGAVLVIGLESCGTIPQPSVHAPAQRRVS